MKSELAAADARGDAAVSDGRKSVGPRFRRNNYRKSERAEKEPPTSTAQLRKGSRDNDVHMPAGSGFQLEESG